MLRSMVNYRSSTLLGRKVGLHDINVNISALRYVRGSIAISDRLYAQQSYQWMQQQNKETHRLSQDQIKLLEDQSFLTTEEETIFKKLLEEYHPVSLSVNDISGGCGSMYSIHITSEKFDNLPIFKQHQMVNEFLKEDIAKWHGIQLITKKVKKPKN
ncbi:Bol3p PWA37_003163 [Arxiozyma heterogenica]|uniref:Bola-like protein n=1 Tax=Arxiozyma heterogenica TaxID=278026 RepID=A0AAN7WRF7_9SACH|nr:hypothetical protein RI543_001651 [Kazachstania heterogenica]